MVCFYLKYPVIQIGVTDTEVWSLIASLTCTETFNCAAQEKGHCQICIFCWDHLRVFCFYKTDITFQKITSL